MKNSSNRLIFPTFVCMEGSADKIFEVLKRYWGFTEFRPVQERIIRSAMAGRDTLALMPTGGGKSLTYQVPGLAQPGLCIVVTPLIALMKDQVDRLRARRIPACLHNSPDSLKPLPVRAGSAFSSIICADGSHYACNKPLYLQAYAITAATVFPSVIFPL